jgi:hypothetical protein
MAFSSKYDRPRRSVRALLARLRMWLAESAPDPEASPASVLGCIYLLLIGLVDIFDYAFQHTLQLFVANGARALIMLLILVLLPAGRYLDCRLRQPRRWMFVLPVLLAGFESVRSMGSVFRTHAVASAIIACIALTFAVRFPDRMHRWIDSRRGRWFCIAIFLSVLLVHATLKPKEFDIGYTSMIAVDSILAGVNPYNVDLDRFDFALGRANEASFRGYKYSPLLPFLYLPMVKIFGHLGILLANFATLVLTAFTIAAVSQRIFGGDGQWAAALFLVSPLVGMCMLVYQTNDLVAVLPVCVAFLISDRRAGIAGLLLGVSASIKIMPAPIAMALLLPRHLHLQRAGRFVMGIAIGLIPVMVFAALDPVAFFNNVVMFHFVRPASPASLLLDVPSSVIWSLRVLFASTFLVTAVTAAILDWSTDRRMTAYVVLTMALLLTSQTNFDNYWLWWIPLFIPLLCRGRGARPFAAESFRQEDRCCG